MKRRDAERALTQALYLALIAPDDEKADRAVRLAARISHGMDAGRVDVCKAAALARFKADDEC